MWYLRKLLIVYYYCKNKTMDGDTVEGGLITALLLEDWSRFPTVLLSFSSLG